MTEFSKQVPEKTPYILLDRETILSRMKELSPNWTVLQDKCLYREFHFPNFKQALAFTNQVGQIAEEERHHPDIYLSYHEVGIKIFTHEVGGLSEKDFALAKLIEAEHATFI